MAKSDIKLLDDFDGQVKVEAADLLVDGGEARRHGSTTPYRRAFVHDGNDGLIVNYANDYGGGVTINGVTKITGHTFHVDRVPMRGITIEGGMLMNLNAVSLTFKGAGIILDCEPDQAAGVKISGNVQFEKDVTIHGDLKLRGKVQAGTFAPPGWTPPYYDLTDEINNLKAKVAALETKVGNV